MAYFACMVGGSGKGNTVTVTCAEEFAGLTITLAKTGKIYTKACPSTAPYVVTFYGVENGTYTVSCTVDGQTYSETVIVQDISCVLNYGFTWRTWVDTASQLDSSDYDSLDEVLADEKALRELFLEHACVDYMAEATSSNADLETIIENDLCAKWINNSDYALDFLGANTVIKALMDEADKYFYGEWVITDDTTTPPTWGAKGNVPKMISNTAPYGEASSSNPTYTPYAAFDGDASTNAVISLGASYYLRYKFTNPVNIKRILIQNRNNSRGNPATYKFQGSNDGTNWEDLTDTVTNTNPTTALAKSYHDATLNTDKYYLYAQVIVYTASEGDNAANISTLQFYGRELKVSVPTMTSDTAPYGTAYADSLGDNRQAYMAFDKVNNTYWQAARDNAYIQYTFTTKIVPKFMSIFPFYDSINKTRVKNWKLQGINGNLNPVDITTGIIEEKNTTATTYVNVDCTDSYDTLRFNVLDIYKANAGAVIWELNIWGLDYSEKEFEAGTTKKWLYDHGVKLGITGFDTVGDDGTVTEDGFKFELKKTNASSAGDVYIYGMSTNSVDFTTYSRLFTRCDVTEGKQDGSNVPIIATAKTESWDLGDSRLASKMITNGGPLEYLSVSAINQSAYVGFGVGWNQSLTDTKVYELWLE